MFKLGDTGGSEEKQSYCIECIYERGWDLLIVVDIIFALFNANPVFCVVTRANTISFIFLSYHREENSCITIGRAE